MNQPDGQHPPQTALVLQGGGALGAYQAGVYEALAGTELQPDWIAGISIGAINAAIIAGNPAERRVERLRTFWDRVSGELQFRLDSPQGFARRAFNEASAVYAASLGVPGFFTPRFPPLLPEWPAELDRLSYYDTAPLRTTLLELVDFDLLNRGPIRFSIGAVNVLNGNFVYFDNREHTIGPEHVMASGALPPGFAPVKIGDDWFWDGGLVSNTPLQYVLDARPACELTVFQVDLFSSRGVVPRTMADVAQREKDIRYSSRTRLNTDQSKKLQKLHAAARRLAKRLPDELRDDPDLRTLLNHEPEGSVAIMHLINRCASYESASKDYEFSRLTVNEHWSDGYEDAAYSLAHPDWIGRTHAGDAITTFDLAGDRPRQTGALGSNLGECA
ncbi:NTE family protein [Novosphingobium chloroacetimidivorans]|uniref:NTE family protein n=1 Tax=Novosphingobium chloroacetimidivorans TaxID=1428314 RepID=A0A7W7NWI4_9SPHN|nr:patatin-like phospholipase family protein [Novosphingobium chloroacetimidivorans]MBB4859371.1 NTE family protein [Novosphingobium chloroacetimidivorans]